MESILYNAEKKEVVCILGYGIGNHLSLNYLREIIEDLWKIFPNLSPDILADLKFLEVSDRSRRHKYHWYTRFDYDLELFEKNKWNSEYLLPGDHSAYIVTSHKKGVNDWTQEDESAESIMNRLIHD